MITLPLRRQLAEVREEQERNFQRYPFRINTFLSVCFLNMNLLFSQKKLKALSCIFTQEAQNLVENTTVYLRMFPQLQ